MTEADILYSKGDYTNSLPLYEAKLQQQKLTHGEFSIDTMFTMKRLAECYSSNGDIDSARCLNTEYLKKMSLVYGINHPINRLNLPQDYTQIKQQKYRCIYNGDVAVRDGYDKGASKKK